MDLQKRTFKWGNFAKEFGKLVNNKWYMFFWRHAYWHRKESEAGYEKGPRNDKYNLSIILDYANRKESFIKAKDLPEEYRPVDPLHQLPFQKKHPNYIRRMEALKTRQLFRLATIKYTPSAAYFEFVDSLHKYMKFFQPNVHVDNDSVIDKMDKHYKQNFNFLDDYLLKYDNFTYDIRMKLHKEIENRSTLAFIQRAMKQHRLTLAEQFKITRLTWRAHYMNNVLSKLITIPPKSETHVYPYSYQQNKDINNDINNDIINGTNHKNNNTSDIETNDFGFVIKEEENNSKGIEKIKKAAQDTHLNLLNNIIEITSTGNKYNKIIKDTSTKSYTDVLYSQQQNQLNNSTTNKMNNVGNTINNDKMDNNSNNNNNNALVFEYHEGKIFKKYNYEIPPHSTFDIRDFNPRAHKKVMILKDAIPDLSKFNLKMSILYGLFPRLLKALYTPQLHDLQHITIGKLYAKLYNRIMYDKKSQIRNFSKLLRILRAKFYISARKNRHILLRVKIKSVELYCRKQFNEVVYGSLVKPIRMMTTMVIRPHPFQSISKWQIKKLRRRTKRRATLYKPIPRIKWKRFKRIKWWEIYKRKKMKKRANARSSTEKLPTPDSI